MRLYEKSQKPISNIKLASRKIQFFTTDNTSVIVLDKLGIDETLLGWGLFYPGSDISISEDCVELSVLFSTLDQTIVFQKTL